MNDLIQATITERQMMSSDVVSLMLTNIDGSPLPALLTQARLTHQISSTSTGDLEREQQTAI